MQILIGYLSLFLLMGCGQKDPDERESDLDRMAQVEEVDQPQVR